MSYFSLKICVIGNVMVGKSSLVVRFINDSFDNYIAGTVGAAFLSKMVKTKKGSHYKLNIWDTAGQERFRSLTPLFYRDASVVLVVYSIANRESFTYGAKWWINTIQSNNKSDIVIVLVGNKADMESNREVRTDEAREFADQVGAKFYEASAKTGFNVKKIFQDICTKFESENNRHLTLVCEPAKRTLTVLADTGEQIQQQNTSTSHCCES